MELLSPAGNYESFIGAINAGADAVYLAGSSFGARAYADNFSDEEIIKAIDYAHLFGKKVYLTVNTLVKEKEISKAIDFVKPFYLAGLDGVIIQDIGLISIFRKIYPKLELHASTQCFITGTNAGNYFKELGCCRLVLARELSLKEIEEVKKETYLEVETFIHGSMCYSYSGDCLFSSCLGQRSGNRGRCAGPCRLSYNVHDSRNLNSSKEGYYLSMKDQCTLALLPKLIDAGIDSLKIEGRMKKAEYAAFVTSMYRKYIDLYLSNPNSYKVSDKDINKLKSMYMRSQIQEGYYERTKGKEMISVESPSYNGSDEALMASIREKYITSNKRLPVSIFFSINKDNPVLLTMNCLDQYVTIEGAVASKALKSAITDESIEKSMTKLGDTFFCLDSITIDNDNDSFVSIASLNEVRREACANLMDQLLLPFRRSLDDIKEYTREIETGEKEVEKKRIVTVLTKEQYEASLVFSDKFTLCISFDILDEIDLSKLKGCEYFIDMPYALRQRNESKIRKCIVENPKASFICHNTEELFILKSMGLYDSIVAGPENYNWNIEATKVIDRDCKYNILPYELSSHELKDVINEKSIVTVYGRVPLMVSENCVQRTAFSCRSDNKPSFTYITDRKNIDLPVYLSCKNCYNVVYNAIRTSLHEFILSGKLQSDSYLINLTNEGYEETKDVLTFYDMIFEGKKPVAPFKEFTKSYYNKGVE